MVHSITTRKNPFTERGRITDPQRFIGRWRELSIVFDRLADNRPVLISGPPGIGKSSLLTHVAQSGAVNLEDPTLRAFYADLSVLPGAESCYELIVRALGSRGQTPAALEVALLETDGPVLLCLDGAEEAIAAGWGERLLESLARMARRSRAVSTPTAALPYAGEPILFLAAAVRSPLPTLSEPFATVTLGAMSTTEARLFVDTYLDDTGLQFTSQEVRDLNALSAGHPAYFQRAAFHLFNAKTQPDYDWRALYLEEAREQPVPGAPLPPGVFESDAARAPESVFHDPGGAGGQAPRTSVPQLEEQGSLVAALLLLVAAFLALQLTGSWLVAGMVVIVGIALIVFIERRGGKT